MLLHIHSVVRYFVLLSGAAVLLVGIYGLATRRPYGLSIRQLASTFGGLLLAECVIGSLLLVSGRFGNAMIGHMFTTLGATAIVYYSTLRVRRTHPEQRSYLPHVLGAAAALLLIAVGIMAVGEPVVG